MTVTMPAIPRVSLRWARMPGRRLPTQMNNEDPQKRGLARRHFGANREWPTRAEFNLLNISGRTAHPLFMWTTAFGIKSAIRGIDSFEALSGFPNGPSNGEIIRLALDHQRISSGRKHEFLLLWPND
jgi:hypothetical protein